ncbi:MAG: hypothetical protein HY467_02925 [Betaproteobacteria bacterium]|nr:hypothetical protein [Betaproteobacteria bacterium]
MLARAAAIPDAPFAGPGLALVERPHTPKYVVACAGAAARAIAASMAAETPGQLLACSPGTVVHGQRCTTLWLRPDRWLVIGADPEGRSTLEDWLRRVLARSGGVLVDVSDGEVELDVLGARARQVLARYCALDLDPRVFGYTSAARTLVAGIECVLYGRPVDDGVALLVPRSCALYLWRRLRDVAVRSDDGGDCMAAILPEAPAARGGPCPT